MPYLSFASAHRAASEGQGPSSSSSPERLPAPWRGLRPGLAALAAALLLAYGLLAPELPRLPYAAGLTVTLAVNCLLLALLLYGLSPLRDARLAALVLGAVALAGAIAFSFAGWTAAASLCKVLAAAALGFGLVAPITSTSLVLLIVVLAAAVDILSVAFGPTRALLDNAPSAVGALTVAMLWPGYAAEAGYTALGVSDIVFMALYIGAAAKFCLREGATAIALAAAVAATVVAAQEFTALPVLPLLGVAFVIVNADLLFWRRRREPPSEAAGEADEGAT